MVPKLAVETLEVILEHALAVPDVHFSSTSARSPFHHEYRIGQERSRPHNLLLVCAQWLRVGTPALYRTAVLRSPMQARALARVLERHPHFAAYMRKLRLEGGLGAAAGRIMAAVAPYLTSLCLSLRMTWMDDVKATCEHLPLLNPARLILYAGERAEPRSCHKCGLLLASLQAAVSRWNALSTVVFPASMIHVVSEPLARAPSLVHVHIRERKLREGPVILHLMVFMQMPSVRSVSLAIGDLPPEDVPTLQILSNIRLLYHKLLFSQPHPAQEEVPVVN